MQENLKESVEKNKLNFMETKYKDDAMVEGILSLWKISSSGQIEKDKEISFEYDGDFTQTEQGKMKLSLSHDRTIISLGMQKEENSHPGVHILAWYVRSLRRVNISKKLADNLHKECHGKLMDLKFVGKSKFIYVVMELKDKDSKKKKTHYHISRISTGQKVFTYHNAKHLDEGEEDPFS